MKVAILCNEALKAELLSPGSPADVELLWLDTLTAVESADAIIDLVFDGSPERVHWLQSVQTDIVIVNAVVETGAELPPEFVRLNAWITFLQRPVAEMAGPSGKKAVTEKIMKGFHRSVEWVPDQTGMLTPRVISMIINEAYFALEENVSTREEIDTAMKLGTNYPYGPFEWAERIGKRNLLKLLKALTAKNPHYRPSAALEKEAAE